MFHTVHIAHRLSSAPMMGERKRSGDPLHGEAPSLVATSVRKLGDDWLLLKFV